MEEKVRGLVTDAQRIVVIQADNPDADSSGSALALEQILGEMGKSVALYCGVDMPSYLHYLSGWDRVLKDLPNQFDLSIVVDASTYSLFDQLEKAGKWGIVKSRPTIVLDHHASVEKSLDFATASIIDSQAASTGEIIFKLCAKNNWTINAEAAEHLMTSILGDTQGLTNELTRASTYRVMAELTELGADRPKLEELRREYSKMSEEIYLYKGELIKRTEFAAGGKIASVTVPQSEINTYSPLYNPAALVQFDMLQVSGVELCIVFKSYDDGHVTGAIRANHGAAVAGQLAEHMGGGGHDYAAGFKDESGKPFEEIKSNCLNYATELLDKLDSNER